MFQLLMGQALATWSVADLALGVYALPEVCAQLIRTGLRARDMLPDGSINRPSAVVVPCQCFSCTQYVIGM